MINLKYSINNSCSYQVFRDDNHIGNIHVTRNMLSDRYYAVVFYDGKRNPEGKDFSSPHEALSYLMSR